MYNLSFWGHYNQNMAWYWNLSQTLSGHLLPMGNEDLYCKDIMVSEWTSGWNNGSACVVMWVKVVKHIITVPRGKKVQHIDYWKSHLKCMPEKLLTNSDNEWLHPPGRNTNTALFKEWGCDVLNIVHLLLGQSLCIHNFIYIWIYIVTLTTG